MIVAIAMSKKSMVCDTRPRRPMRTRTPETAASLSVCLPACLHAHPSPSFERHPLTTLSTRTLSALPCCCTSSTLIALLTPPDNRLSSWSGLWTAAMRAQRI